MIRRYFAAEAQRLLQEDGTLAALLDVREKYEFTAEHIAWATPLSRGRLELDADRLLMSADVPVLCYAGRDTRAERAAETLASLGYAQAAVLHGGVSAWRAAGLETVYGWGFPGKDWGEKIFVQHAVPEVTADELAALIDRDEALVVDSRTGPEFHRGHIPGAMSVPGGELVVVGPELARQAGSRTIVVHCAGRTRSVVGADLLRRMGIANVVALKGGTGQWMMTGRALETESFAHAPEPCAEAAQTSHDYAERVRRAARIPTIEPEALAALGARQPHYVVDVRLPDRYDAGHIPGAFSCPLGQIPLASEEFVALRRAPVVVYCDDTRRATVAAQILREIGYPASTVLAGGLSAWREGGHRVATREPARGLPLSPPFGSNVSAAELRRLVDAGAPVQIVDVRGLREYDAGHIVGSRFIPRGTLEDRASVLAGDRGVTIVTYCDDCARAIGAARAVRELRPEHRVVWLDGGLAEWRRAGGAVEPGVDGTGLTADHVREDVSATDLGSARTSIAQEGGFSAAFMQRYLEWEERLGEKYRQHRPVA